MLNIILLLTIGFIPLITAQECGPNEIKSNCAPPIGCQASCEKLDGVICPRICIRNACVCKKGFVRESENNSNCIEPTQCPIVHNNSSFECGPNEVETDCALVQTCQPSCEHPNGTACPRVCSENPCVCKDGFIRDSNNNFTCIEKTECQPLNDSFIMPLGIYRRSIPNQQNFIQTRLSFANEPVWTLMNRLRKRNIKRRNQDK